MTQAFNLSQLANRVNTSGQVNAANGLFNQTPVANGGTGRSSVTAGALLLGAGTSAMTEFAGTTPGTTIASSPTGWTSVPTASVGGGNYVLNQYTSPATWSKPGTLKAVKVTVVGAGGRGGGSAAGPSIVGGGGGGGGGAAIIYIPAPSIPGPVAVTAGAGTNSFGGFCSATAGSSGSQPPAAAAVLNLGASGGVGTGGTINIGGSAGSNGVPSQATSNSGAGGASILGGGGVGRNSSNSGAGNVGRNFGGGGGGAVANIPTSQLGGLGAPGIVIIEEFY
jgi:hypothetical protein